MVLPVLGKDPSEASAAEGDALITVSTNYTIRDVIDDGTGMITLILEAD